MVQQYLQQVGMAVFAQGKPSNGTDFVTEMASRAKTAIKEIVPANYRLAVRVAVKRYLKQLTAAARGI
jgi:hypothetical protein